MSILVFCVYFGSCLECLFAFLNFYASFPFRCDRILSFGKGLRLLSYRRTELRLSDHRPVTASYMVDVEVFCPRKLQRALTFTDAEIENQDVAAEMSIDVGMSRLRFVEVSTYLWVYQLHKQQVSFRLFLNQGFTVG